MVGKCDYCGKTKDGTWWIRRLGPMSPFHENVQNMGRILRYCTKECFRLSMPNQPLEPTTKAGDLRKP